MYSLAKNIFETNKYATLDINWVPLTFDKQTQATKLEGIYINVIKKFRSVDKQNYEFTSFEDMVFYQLDEFMRARQLALYQDVKDLSMEEFVNFIQKDKNVCLGILETYDQLIDIFSVEISKELINSGVITDNQ
jgi:hypothetical protein